MCDVVLYFGLLNVKSFSSFSIYYSVFQKKKLERRGGPRPRARRAEARVEA
jgi:hypothetical protein